MGRKFGFVADTFVILWQNFRTKYHFEDIFTYDDTRESANKTTWRLPKYAKMIWIFSIFT